MIKQTRQRTISNSDAYKLLVDRYIRKTSVKKLAENTNISYNIVKNVINGVTYKDVWFKFIKIYGHPHAIK